MPRRCASVLVAAATAMLMLTSASPGAQARAGSATAHSLNGRDEIAEVSSTCGAGCTYIGATGTEMLTSYFETMYNEIAESGLYDQIPFYELGRSFWFYSPQLQFHSPDQDPVLTGFAVWMRFRAMAAAHGERCSRTRRALLTLERQTDTALDLVIASVMLVVL